MDAQTLGIIFSIVGGILGGLTVLGGFLISIGKKYQLLDTLNSSLKDISTDVKDVRERFGGIEEKVDVLWKDRFAPANSPRQLNNRGEKILKDSGIKEIVENKKDELLNKIKEISPKTPYDAELVINSVMMDLGKHYPNIVDELKNGAFKTGSDVNAILFVGSIYLRNLIFKDLGFDLEDLDKLNK